ncbi:hypothetical protein Tco_0838301 [Tanacetum coccineum]|uniref:Uncharacterized protein n=1 Tax=Tanacetum coccineum TaxID=301880 RepID=A0ABQ5AS00_9ASTR
MQYQFLYQLSSRRHKRKRKADMEANSQYVFKKDGSTQGVLWAIDTINVAATAIVSAGNRQQQQSSSSSSSLQVVIEQTLGSSSSIQHLVREAQKPNGAHMLTRSMLCFAGTTMSCLKASSYLAEFTSYKQVAAEMKALAIKKDPNHFNYHIYTNGNFHRFKDNGEVTDRVTNSGGEVGRSTNGGADAVAVTILKWYEILRKFTATLLEVNRQYYQKDATVKLQAHKATTREDVDGVSKKYAVLIFNQVGSYCYFSSATAIPISFNSGVEKRRSDVFVNGQLLMDRAVKNAEKLAGSIHLGEYW